MASVTTVLVNANPLMKFDGYYILSDLLAIPNLHSHGNTYLTYWCRRYLLGVTAVLPPWPTRQRVLIAIYGVAACVWRVLVCVGLTLGASTLFGGWGILLSALAIALWFGAPALRLLKYLFCGCPGERPQLGRFAAVVLMPALLVVWGVSYVPWFSARSAVGVVEYDPGATIRANSAGFIREVYVRGGDRVDEGQLLILLHNPETEQELSDLEISIRQTQLRCRALKQKQQIAEFQAERKQLESLQQQLSEKQTQVDHLEIRAPCGGRVSGYGLDNLVGTHVRIGDELLTIGDEKFKRIQVLLGTR